MRALVPALLGAVLLTACTGGQETASSSGPAPVSPSAGEPSSPPAPSGDATPASPAAPGTPTPAASGTPDDAVGADDAPPFPANTADDRGEPSGGPLTVVAVRAARQDGFDRVVFELRGQEPGEPGWVVGYTDEPSQQGSGREVEVEGTRTLEVLVTGVGYPFDTGQEEASADLQPTGTAVVREVDLQATFEGQFQAFVGLDREVPFRVYRLTDPARVVLEVRHS